MRAIRLAAAITIALMLNAAAALAGPAVATRYTVPDRWKNAPTTQDACLARAEAAMLDTGFSDIERTGQSRYGTMREYTATVRCIMDKAIVLIVVSGPARQTADRGAAALFQNFEAGR
jgi:hypothetical protein